MIPFLDNSVENEVLIVVIIDFTSWRIIRIGRNLSLIDSIIDFQLIFCLNTFVVTIINFPLNRLKLFFQCF